MKEILYYSYYYHYSNYKSIHDFKVRINVVIKKNKSGFERFVPFLSNCQGIDIRDSFVKKIEPARLREVQRKLLRDL